MNISGISSITNTPVALLPQSTTNTPAPVVVQDVATPQFVPAVVPDILNNADNTISTVAQSLPEDAVASAPQEVVVPPLTSFNTMAGESTEIKPAPEGDASSVGGHGEVPTVVPSLPAFNNTAAASAEAFLETSAGSVMQRPFSGKRVRDYFRTVRKRAQTTDLEFRRQKLPYRLKVLTDANENVMIDLSVLNEKGGVVRHETRNVTNENFGKLMDDISSGKGLLIDDLPTRQ
jgi:hypothetical protein